MHTAPGFWMRSALTIWNTSTIPSVLQHSMVLSRAQNTPHRLTVSLGRRGEGRLGAIITVPRCSCRICGALEGGGNNYLSYTHTHTKHYVWERAEIAVTSASGAITNGKPRIPIPPPKLQFSPQLRYHYGSALCYIIQYGTSLNRLSGIPHPHCESLATKREYL